jgi:hypothetical protein
MDESIIKFFEQEHKPITKMSQALRIGAKQYQQLIGLYTHTDGYRVCALAAACLAAGKKDFSSGWESFAREAFGDPWEARFAYLHAHGETFDVASGRGVPFLEIADKLEALGY